MSEDYHHLTSLATRSELDDVVKTIAEQLGEHEVEPLRQLHTLVKYLGTEQSLAFLKEALDVEEKGGLLVTDGSRRRTLGGVFFYLVRTKGPKRVRRLFFTRRTVQAAQGAPSASPALKPATPAPFTWADRVAVLDTIGTEKGVASSVKITVIGRPGKIVDRGTCIVTSMRARTAPSLPKGLPTPPTVPTNYLVYVAAKQWRKVAETIKDPEDVLIIEGFPQLDPETSSIAVFATNTTTKKLQMAQRQPQGAAKSESM